jgi:hypothetical protein
MAPLEIHDLVQAWEARERRRDHRAGQVCWLLAEINRDRDKKPQPFHVADFFASLEDLRPAPTDEEEWDAVEAMMSRHAE